MQQFDIGGLKSAFERKIKYRFTMQGQSPIVINAPNAVRKATATNARLISAHLMQFDGVEWSGGSDSVCFFWSGTRGAEFDYAKYILTGMFTEAVDPDTPKHEFQNLNSYYREMKMDSIQGYSWDSTNRGFRRLTNKSVASRERDLIAILTNSNLIGGIWESTSRELFSWNNEAKLFTLNSEEMDGTIWTPRSRSTIQYTSASEFEEILSESYDKVSATWVNNRKHIFEYTDNNLTSLEIQRWDGTSGAFENERRMLYYYSSNQLEQIRYQDWYKVASKWVFDLGMSFSRSTDGSVRKRFLSYWDPMLAKWMGIYRVYYDYNSNRELEKITVSYVTATGAHTGGPTYEYNYTTVGNNRLVIVDVHNWERSSWEKDMRLTITYNQFDKITEIKTQTWDGAAWVDANGDIIFTFKYETFENGTNIRADLGLSSFTEIRIYPNPAAGLINIDAGNKEVSSVRLSDMTGRTVLQMKPEASTSLLQLAVDNLVPGIYSLELNLDGCVETRNVQIQ